MTAFMQTANGSSVNTTSPAPNPTLLNQLLRFAPSARMFYSGTLCALAQGAEADGLKQGTMHLLSRGELQLTRKGLAPLNVSAPSVLLLPRPLEHWVQGVGPDGVDLMCAALSEMAPPLSMIIPDITVIDLTATPSLMRPVELLFEEADAREFGYRTAIDRLLQYTFVALIRHLINRQMLSGGVLDAMADARLGAVLEMLHESPEHDWTLDSMSELAHMSRSAFALRFAQVVGLPPLTYLTNWRMALARTLLSQGQVVKVVSSQVGYQNAAAFARAFQRATGQSPSAWQAEQLSQT